MLHSGVFCRVFDKVPKSRNNPHINTEPIIALTLLDCENIFLMHLSIKHQIRTRNMMVLHHFTQNNTETAVVCKKINNLHCLIFLNCLQRDLFYFCRPKVNLLLDFSIVNNLLVNVEITLPEPKSIVYVLMNLSANFILRELMHITPSFV